MPTFLGASALGNVFRKTNEVEAIKVVHEAIKSGINYIDVAPWYGHGVAETVLGKVRCPVNGICANCAAQNFIGIMQCIIGCVVYQKDTERVYNLEFQ